MHGPDRHSPKIALSGLCDSVTRMGLEGLQGPGIPRPTYTVLCVWFVCTCSPSQVVSMSSRRPLLRVDGGAESGCLSLWIIITQ